MKRKNDCTIDECCDLHECSCGDEGCSCEDCGGGCDTCEEVDYKDLAEQYLTLAKQVQADFDNYRKRNVEAVRQAKDDGKASVVVKILPCADIIEKAISMTTDSTTLEGLRMVANKFQDILSGLGVTKYESKGQQFDVSLHNAVTAIESDEPSGTIIDEYESGYRMGDKVIRFAQVIISK